MAEEEKQEQEETQEPEGEEAAAEPEAAEETPAAEPAEEEEPAQEEAPAEESQTAAQGEPEVAEGDLGPKARRRLKRSRAAGPPRPARTPEQRATERAERRHVSKALRRGHRAARHRKRGEAGTGTPPAAGEPGPKKVRQGTVVSADGDKTITVEIAVARRHSSYEKIVRRTSRLRAHDEANQAQEGDVVRVVESRPLSRTKRWRLLDIVERAR